MGRTYFLFGVHNHQPVGNFHYVFEEAFNRCYRPFITTLERYPKIKCNLHISGSLYDWILANKRKFIDKIRKMSHAGQLEIISGGYYEPILPVIPDEDKLAQIEMMNKFIEKNFHNRPRGIWIAERIWEPSLASIINQAGLRYVFVDDTHFRYAGFSQKEFFGYYITEDSLKPVYVFPISKTLRYKIPFSQAHEAVDLLKSFCGDEDVLVTLFDDGEKFGLWPNTFDWVYNKKWLQNFFELLTRNIDTIQTVTANEAIRQFKPKGLVYLPTASYEEMGEWVLDKTALARYERLEKYIENNADLGESKDFIRGGFFRNFYRKYPRLNYMHKKMFALSQKLHARKSLKNTKKMFNYLHMAQCNCGYWHGIFGGFYLGHIRAAIYENLIKAEKEFDKKTLDGSLGIERFDIDLDGVDETIVKNNHLILTLSDRGAAIVELSFKDCDFNLLNTVTRYEESYHRKIRQSLKKQNSSLATIHDNVCSKDEDLDKYLIYDGYERLAAVDHLLAKDISIEDFNAQRNIHTLSNKVYRSRATKRKNDIVLRYIYQGNDLEFHKKITFAKEPSFSIEYCFNEYGALKNYDFGIEFNLFLQSPKDVIFTAAGEEIPFQGQQVFKKVTALGIRDRFKKIYIGFTIDKADVFIMPIYSVSSSEYGFEKVYQQMSVLFIKKTEKSSFNLLCRLTKEG